MYYLNWHVINQGDQSQEWKYFDTEEEACDHAGDVIEQHLGFRPDSDRMFEQIADLMYWGRLICSGLYFILARAE